jgi:hypothetical protein
MTCFKRLVPPCCVLLLIAILAVPEVSAKDAKLTPAEVIAKHIASIGSAEAIAAVKSRAATGTGTVVFRLGGHGQMEGTAGVLSDGGRTRIGINFNSSEYPGEVFVCDGKDVETGTVQPGRRSTLSTFIHQFDFIMKEGLLGGELTTGWALLDVPGHQAKIDYTGLKKLDGRPVHELKYRPKKSADLTIFLSFDAETFHHVLTQYRLVQPAGMASSPGESASMRDTRYTLIETFSEFHTVDGLTLPHLYKIGYTLDGQGGSFLADWTVVIAEFVNNPVIEASQFAKP